MSFSNEILIPYEITISIIQLLSPKDYRNLLINKSFVSLFNNLNILQELKFIDPDPCISSLQSILKYNLINILKFKKKYKLLSIISSELTDILFKYSSLEIVKYIVNSKISLQININTFKNLSDPEKIFYFEQKKIFKKKHFYENKNLIINSIGKYPTIFTKYLNPITLGNDPTFTKQIIYKLLQTDNIDEYFYLFDADDIFYELCKFEFSKYTKLLFMIFNKVDNEIYWKRAVKIVYEYSYKYDFNMRWMSKKIVEQKISKLDLVASIYNWDEYSKIEYLELISNEYKKNDMLRLFLKKSVKIGIKNNFKWLIDFITSKFQVKLDKIINEMVFNEDGDENECLLCDSKNKEIWNDLFCDKIINNFDNLSYKKKNTIITNAFSSKNLKLLTRLQKTLVVNNHSEFLSGDAIIVQFLFCSTLEIFVLMFELMKPIISSNNILRPLFDNPEFLKITKFLINYFDNDKMKFCDLWNNQFFTILEKEYSGFLIANLLELENIGLEFEWSNLLWNKLICGDNAVYFFRKLVKTNRKLPKYDDLMTGGNMLSCSMLKLLKKHCN